MALYKLHWLDYFLFLTVLLVTTTIGAVFAFIGGRQQTTDDYFTGNRKLNVLPTSLSVVVTYMSAVMVIGIPAEAYSYGGQLFLAAMGEAIGLCLAVILIVPILYPLDLLSINKYLEMRYQSPYPKLFATVMGVIQTITYSAVVIVTPSTAVSSILGVPVFSVILVTAVLAVIYTTIGGIKAVIWSDAFLCVCMLSGMMLICVQGVKYAGGLSIAYKISLEGGRLNLFNFSPNPTERLTVWSMILGIGFNGISVYGLMQPSLQRYSNVASLRKARLTLLLAIFGIIFMFIIPISAGISIYAYYKHIGCDPIQARIIEEPNQLVPHFMMEMLGVPGVPGVFIASLAAASLSTVSSALNSSAANLWDDILKDSLPLQLAGRGALVSKVVVTILGIMATLFCFVLMFLGGTVFQLSVSLNSITLLPLAGMVLHGIFCPWINAKGIITGSIVGLMFLLWIMIGQNFNTTYTISRLPTDISQCNITESPLNQDNVNYTHLNGIIWAGNESKKHNITLDNLDDGQKEVKGLNLLYSISYVWYFLAGNIVIFIVGSIVSLLTGSHTLHQSQNHLITPCCRKMSSHSNRQITVPVETEELSLKTDFVGYS